MLSLDKNSKTSLPPQKMNIFGRKRYSVDTGVTDVIECSFDDCWRAISRIWLVLIGLSYILYRQSNGCRLLKKCLNSIETLFQDKTNT